MIDAPPLKRRSFQSAARLGRPITRAWLGLCTNCQQRQRQTHSELCYRCFRGAAPVPRFEEEQARLARRQAQLEALRIKPLDRPPLVKVIDGVEYEVVYDGTIR